MARIPFDIKYRPQIESGEYKVELRDGRSVKIIYWEAKGPAPIIGLFMTDDGSETTTEAHSNGRWSDDENYESDYDLFIITPEEEMTEFESSLRQVLSEALSGEMPTGSSGSMSWAVIINDDEIKKLAPRILLIAKKQLQPEIDAEIEKAYKTQDDVVFHKGLVQGVANTLKDLPRWKQIKDCDTTVRKPHIGTNMIGEKMLYIGNNCISISKIMKLPGFNS